MFMCVFLGVRGEAFRSVWEWRRKVRSVEELKEELKRGVTRLMFRGVKNN